jgi:hypothetical protein
VIPDLQNSLDWDRFAYVRNNPVRYNDPTGHVCSDPEDPNPTCEKAGTTKLKKVSYKIDKDNLTKGGRRAYELYRKARNNPGWWNNNKTGTLTVEQYFGIFELYEAGGQDPALPWVKAASGYQLFLPTPDKFGGNAPYCTGDLCRNGMFNFMAAYQGYGKYGETSDLVERFDTLSYPPALPGVYKSETPADAAADIGNDIVGNRAYYETGDPFSVPYRWHNDMSVDERTFYVTTATGTLLFQYPASK